MANAISNTAVGGGRALNRVPSKRYGPPKVCTVTMAQVPEPPMTQSQGIAEALWQQIVSLKTGTAVKAEFEADKHADYVRTKLRSRAKKNKQFLSSSRSEDGKTRYFWLEKA
jgi:hypothetical protein